MLKSKERQVLLQLILAVWLIAQSLVGLAKQDSAQASANSTSAWVTSNPPYQTTTVKKLTYGVCDFQPSITDERSYEIALKGGRGLASFDGIARSLIIPYEMLSPPQSQESSDIAMDWSDSLDIKRLSEPKHGVMAKINVPDYKGFTDYLYVPNKDYTGKDRIDFLVTGKDLDGKPFELTVKYYINVMADDKLKNAIKNDKTYQQAIKKYCGHSQGQWRISESQAK